MSFISCITNITINQQLKSARITAFPPYTPVIWWDKAARKEKYDDSKGMLFKKEERDTVCGWVCSD